jgi:hypothetical protein
MAVYLLVAYRIECLTVADSYISVRSVFKHHRFDVSQLDCLTWNGRARKSIRFEALGRKSKFYLDSYSPSDQLQMIRLLHELVPVEKQVGWPVFCHTVAIRLRERQSGADAQALSPGQISIHRNRYDRFFAVAVPLSVVLVTAFWWTTGLNNLAPVPIFLIAMWLLLRYSTPTGGLVDWRATARPEGRTMLLGFAILLLAQVVIVAGSVLGNRDLACTIAIAFLLAVLPIVIIRLHTLEKRRHAEVAIAAESAPLRWEQGESVG